MGSEVRRKRRREKKLLFTPVQRYLNGTAFLLELSSPTRNTASETRVKTMDCNNDNKDDDDVDAD